MRKKIRKISKSKKKFSRFSLYSFLAAGLVLIAGVYLLFKPRVAQIDVVGTPEMAAVYPFGKSLFLQNEAYEDTYALYTPTAALSTNPFTVETWVNIPKTASSSASRDYTLVSYNKPQSPSDYGMIYKLSVEFDDVSGTYFPFFQALKANSYEYPANNYLTLTSQTRLPAESWHHLAVTSVSGTNMCIFKLYIDGKLTDTSEKYSENCSVSTQQPTTLVIGKGNGDISGPNHVANAKIHDVRVSNGERYTADFVPSTALLTADTTTATLLHFDGDLNDSSRYQLVGKMIGTHFSFVDNAPSPTPVPSIMPLPSPSANSYPSIAPSCYEQSVSHYAYREICATNGTSTLYHYLDYTCGNETAPRTLGSADLCQLDTSLLDAAKYFCKKNICQATPVPSRAPSSTPVASVKPSPTPVVSVAPSVTPVASSYLRLSPSPTPKASSYVYPSPSAVSYASPRPSTSPYSNYWCTFQCRIRYGLSATRYKTCVTSCRR